MDSSFEESSIAFIIIAHRISSLVSVRLVLGLHPVKNNEIIIDKTNIRIQNNIFLSLPLHYAVYAKAEFFIPYTPRNFAAFATRSTARMNAPIRNDTLYFSDV